MTFRGGIRGLGIGIVSRFTGDARRSSAAVAAPDAPTIGLATAGTTSASVTFTPAGGGSPATGYTVTSTPGSLTATGAASPLVVTGLTPGTAYTFTAHASNGAGDSAESAATGSVMPLWLWGVYPLWHHSSTTPNADGAISAIADMSLSLYPLSQGTGANQPTRGSGKITSAGSHWLESLDATLIGWAVGTDYGVLLVAELSGSTPGANEGLIGWGHRTTASRYGFLRHSTGDALVGLQRHGGTSMTVTGSSALDATRRTYAGRFTNGASGVITIYRSGALEGTSATADPGSTASDVFAIGNTSNGSFGTGLNGSFVAAVAMSRIPTAGEMAEWDAYLVAGCPPRSA